MTATPAEDLVTKLRAAHPDLLLAACSGRDDVGALAAYMTAPEQAEYFQLGRTDDGEVNAKTASNHVVGCLRAIYHH